MIDQIKGEIAECRRRFVSLLGVRNVTLAKAGLGMCDVNFDVACPACPGCAQVIASIGNENPIAVLLYQVSCSLVVNSP